MTDNNVNKNLQNIFVECPRCHIKLKRKEIQLHNIKCRMLNNQIEKTIIKNTNEKNQKILIKDEYKDFIDKIRETEIDDKSVKSIMKNFILIFGNKIELLEKNIKQINDYISNINKKNSLYFKKINDALDNINKKYINKEDKYKKNNKEKELIKNSNKISTFHKNETDLNKYIPKDMGKEKFNQKKNGINPFCLKEKEKTKKDIKNNANSKKKEKRQFNSEKTIIEINKETITQFTDNNNNNTKYKEIIKREKKKDNKHKIKKLKPKINDIYDIMNSTNVLNSLNILNEDNMINHTSKKINVQVDMRRSLSFGDINDFRSNQKIKNVNEKYFGDNDGKGQDIPIDINNYDIYVDSLDIIMNKLSYLEESLINLGLNDEDLKEKLFNIKSKEFEYSCSDSNSFHSDQ
jgi:hypothetical protein